MSTTLQTTPTFADFVDFVTNAVGVPASALYVDGTPTVPPAASLSYAYGIATELCPVPPLAVGGLYWVMLYNLAAHLLVEYAPDVSGSTYFATARAALGIGGRMANGIVQSTSDNGTSTSLMVPDALKDLSLSELSYMKTPWGRRYLELAQRMAPNWGMS